MHTNKALSTREIGPRLRNWPIPGKILLTMIVVMMAIGMSGALAQIIVHDIIPTLYQKEKPQEPAAAGNDEAGCSARRSFCRRTGAKDRKTLLQDR